MWYGVAKLLNYLGGSYLVKFWLIHNPSATRESETAA